MNEVGSRSTCLAALDICVCSARAKAATVARALLGVSHSPAVHEMRQVEAHCGRPHRCSIAATLHVTQSFSGVDFP